MGTSLLHLESYHYTSLLPASSTFRLLKLLKGQGPELECDLLQQSLLNDGHTPYEALSYVWGSNELVECITLDRKRLWVTDSLHSALQCLRLRDRDRFLWVDAICINQTDKQEQSQQVRQMGTIYKLAKGVLFWLGKATPEIITLMDTLHQIQRIGGEWDLKQAMPDSGRLNDCRTGLRQLLGRQWFTRVWILQEVANAQKGTVCCGTWTIPANIFAQAPSLMGIEPEPHCQAVLDILPDISRSGSWWGQDRDLYTLLCRFQASKATDERDKIYSLLGLSSNPLDKDNIDVDYQQPTSKVIQKAISYLMQARPTSMDDVLNIMDTFKTLDTTLFVPAVKNEETSEILFPHLQSGRKLDKAQFPENTVQGIAIVNDPSLLLLEARPERSLKSQETCYTEVVRIWLNTRTAEAQQHQVYNTGLQVIPWGSIDQHVKLLMIHDRKKAILKAAMHSCGHLVKKLLNMGIGDETEQWLEWSALQEAIQQGQKEAIHTILQQSSRVYTQNGLYDELLQEAVHQPSYNSCEVLALLLDWGRDEAQIMQEVVIAAAENYSYGHEIMTLLLDQKAEKIQITQDVVVAAVKNYNPSKQTIVLLLKQRGNEVQITQKVLVAAAENNKEVLELLLDWCGEEVQITQEVVVAGAGNHHGGSEIIALLLHRRRDEVQATQEVLAAAAGNDGSGKEVIELLLNHHVDKAQITPEVLVAAAGSRCGGKEVIALLLDQRKDEVQITQEVVVAAAGNHRDGSEIIALLLNRRRDEVQATQEVLAAAARNYRSGKEVIELLLDQHVDKAQITPEVLVAAAGNFVNGAEIIELLLNQHVDKAQITQEVLVAATRNNKEVMELILDRRGDEVQITQEVVIAAARGYAEVLELLLNRRGDEVQITPEVAVAAAWNNKEVLELLLDRRGDEVQVTQEVVVAAARGYADVLEVLLNRRGDEVQITQEVIIAASASCFGDKTIELLLKRRRHEVQITQDVVVAAAANYFLGNIIELLLDQCRDEVQITQDVVIAAAGYNKYALALLLNRRGVEVQITQRVVVAAAENNSKDALALLLNWRGDEVQITQEVVVAAAENNSKDVLSLLLSRRGDEVQITPEVVVAAAGNNKEVLELLLDRRGDEVQITQDVVIAAAGSDDSRKAIQYLHQLTPININDTVIQSAATSGQENTLRLFDQWDKASTVTKTWFDIAGLCAAANTGNAEAVLKLTQKGVPPDTQDMRGITPLWRAAARGHTNTVRVLLETNAVDVNVRSVSKRTPLFWPAARGHAEVVELLLRYGAQQNYEDKDGRSPLTIARMMGEMKIVEILQGLNI